MELRRYCFGRNRRRLFDMPYRKKRMTVPKFTWFTQFARFTRFIEFQQCKPGKLSKLCKLILLLCAMSFMLFTFVKAVDAKMKGRCKDCHSMHADAPFPVLTTGGCVGCHGQVPDGTQNIITIGKVRIPQVLHHMGDGDLARGNFYYVADE